MTHLHSVRKKLLIHKSASSAFLVEPGTLGKMLSTGIGGIPRLKIKCKFVSYFYLNNMLSSKPRSHTCEGWYVLTKVFAFIVLYPANKFIDQQKIMMT